MMLAYHHGAWPQQQQIIDDAAAKGIGVVAMKTLKGAKHRGLADFRPEADTYAQKFNIPLGYNAEADQRSWQDMQDFLQESFTK